MSYELCFCHFDRERNERAEKSQTFKSVNLVVGDLSTSPPKSFWAAPVEMTAIPMENIYAT